MRREIRHLDQKYEPDLLVIESTGIGASLISMLEADGLKHVAGCAARLNKEQRCLDVVGLIEGGRVSVLKSAAGLADFRKEIISFPNGKTDDLVDTMTQVLRYRNDALLRARRWKRPKRRAMQTGDESITVQHVYAERRRLVRY